MIVRKKMCDTEAYEKKSAISCRLCEMGRKRSSAGTGPYCDAIDACVYSKKFSLCGWCSRRLDECTYLISVSVHGVFRPTPQKGIAQGLDHGTSSGVTETPKHYDQRMPLKLLTFSPLRQTTAAAGHLNRKVYLLRPSGGCVSFDVSVSDSQMVL
jgi:hypothetical protein